MLLAQLLFHLCLFLPLAQGVKIGISHPSATTPAPAATTTLAVTTPAVDFSSVVMATEETTATPAIFPPRSTTTTTTTIAPPAETQAWNASVSTAATPLAAHYYCSCDLLTDACDLNCCCDRDCVETALSVFNCRLEKPELEQTTHLADFQYTHGLPSCQLNDGWLCVFRTNIKPVKQPPPSQHFDASAYHKWPEQLSATDNAQDSSYYSYGQPLQLWQPERGERRNFELPGAYESAYCQLQQPIRHLQSMSSSCLIMESSLLWSLLNLTSSQRLLPTPHEDVEGGGLIIQICRQLPAGIVCSDNSTELQLEEAGGSFVSELQLQLSHNYTHILGAVLLLKTLAEEPPDPLQRWLSYQVQFIHSSNNTELPVETLSPPAKPTSGALGYELGAPLLISQLQPHNESESELLSYFQVNSSDQHWLPLFTRRDRRCYRSLEQRHAVQFGMDIAKQCQLRLEDPFQLAQQQNYTDYCQRVQAQIWAQLLPPNCQRLADVGRVFISQLGRPHPKQWLPLQLLNDAESELPPVRGDYDAERQALSCRNMRISVRYEFHVVELTLLEGRAEHQRVLQHAALLLGEGRDLEFDVTEDQLELPLAVSVMFYNVQGKQRSGAAALNFNGLWTALLISWLLV